MNAVLALERLGYRFKIDGGKVTALHFGIPPTEAASLLAHITREDIQRVLEDRRNGFMDVQPEELTVPIEKAQACMEAIQAAACSGTILAWEIMPELIGGAVVFLLTPPGCFDGKPWEG